MKDTVNVYDILCEMDRLKSEERALCYNYCEKNPYYQNIRQHERDLIIEGMNRMWNAITELAKK